MHETPAATKASAQRLLEEQQGITRDLLGRLAHAGPRFWTAVAVLGVLFIIGVVGVVLRLQGGFADRARWGYFAATFAFLLTAFQGAPIVSLATRMVKGHWRRPLARASEMFAVVGVLSSVLFLVMVGLIPPVQGRRTLWFEWPVGAPYLFDTLAVVFLAICGLGLLYTAALPDIAVARDHAPGGRKGLWTTLALHWQGTPRQWHMQKVALGVLGGFYLMFFVFTHLLISVDYAMALVPGWKDNIFPAFHALVGLQSGVAITLVALGLLRWVGGYKSYIDTEQFWGLSKLLLALSMLWFYFQWATFITFWYGKLPAEQSVLTFLMFGPYAGLYGTAVLFSFVLPFLLLIWNVVRKSTVGPFLAGCVVLIGAFADRLRLYVAAFSVEDIKAHALESVPAAHLPDGADFMIMIGMVAGAILLYLLATRIIPVVSVWEVKEMLHYRVVRTFMRAKVVVLAKPE
ncbi:MAG: hypothetical protein Q7T26_12620 [Dehalococcoidia bacterium]|nr:hypothetical protein [Dehalococcoidia bacterium]